MLTMIPEVKKQVNWRMTSQTQLLDQKSIFDLLIGSSDCFTKSMEEEKAQYNDYDSERIDYVDLVEPVKKLVTEFVNGNEMPLHELFKTIEMNFDKCDQSASNFIQAGVLETLQTKSVGAGLDPTTCYKMIMNQNVIGIWKKVLQG